jgi:hypothetical protein
VCGGKDVLPNLQWLAIEPHKEKTRVEAKLCRGPQAPTQNARTASRPRLPSDIWHDATVSRRRP